MLLAPASVGVGGLTSVLFMLRNSLFLHLQSLLSSSLSCLLHIYLLPFSPSHFLPNVLCIPAEVKTLRQGQREFRDLLQFSITPMQDTCLFHSVVLFYIYCYVTGRPFVCFCFYLLTELQLQLVFLQLTCWTTGKS